METFKKWIYLSSAFFFFGMGIAAMANPKTDGDLAIIILVVGAGLVAWRLPRAIAQSMQSQ